MGRTAMASEEAKALVKVTKKWNDAFIVLQSFLLPSFEFDGMVLNVCVGHSFSGLMFAEVRCHCVSLSCAGPGDIVSCLCAGLGALYWTGQAQHYHVFLFCYKRLILAWIGVAWTVSLQIFWRCKIPSRLSRDFRRGPRFWTVQWHGFLSRNIFTLLADLCLDYARWIIFLEGQQFVWFVYALNKVVQWFLICELVLWNQTGSLFFVLPWIFFWQVACRCGRAWVGSMFSKKGLCALTLAGAKALAVRLNCQVAFCLCLVSVLVIWWDLSFVVFLQNGSRLPKKTAAGQF